MSTNGIWISDVQVAPLTSSQKTGLSFCTLVSIGCDAELQRTSVTPGSHQPALEGKDVGMNCPDGRGVGVLLVRVLREWY